MTTDLLAQLRAGGPKLPSSLAAPGALTTVEGAARALAAAPWPEGFASTLAREVDTLVPEPGARYAVRSSASIEDEAGVLAAGLFLSRVDVARGEVLEAVRAVLGLRALARRRRVPRAARPVLRQPRLRGSDPRVRRRVTRRARPRSTRRARSRRRSRSTRARGGDRGPRARAHRRRRCAGWRRPTAPVELEWVASGGEPTFLQLRPLQSPGACPPARSSRCRRSIRCPRRRTAI